MGPQTSYATKQKKYVKNIGDLAKDIEYDLVTTMFNHYKKLCMKTFDIDNARLFRLYLERKIDLELERKDADR